MGAIPGLPKVHLHNPVLAYEVGDEFMQYWYLADEGRLGAPFVLVIEGSIPNEKIKSEGYWAALGHRQADRPADHDLRVDRPPGPQGLGRGGGRHLRHLRRHPRHGRQPDRLHGPGRLPRLGLAIDGGRADRQRAGLSGPAGQHDRDAALPPLPGGRPGADDPARPATAADLAVRQDRSRGLRPRQLLRAGAISPTNTARPNASCEIGCWGPVVNCNVTKRGWMAGIGGCPNVGGICIGCTMPGFPDKFMPFMDEPPGGVLSSSVIGMYGKIIRRLRSITNTTVNKEPRWRHNGPELTTGYHPTTYGHNGEMEASHGDRDRS